MEARGRHCVTFPQNVNEPAQIFPRMSKELQIIRVGKQGKMIHIKNLMFAEQRFRLLCNS